MPEETRFFGYHSRRSSFTNVTKRKLGAHSFDSSSIVPLQHSAGQVQKKNRLLFSMDHKRYVNLSNGSSSWYGSWSRIHKCTCDDDEYSTNFIYNSSCCSTHTEFTDWTKWCRNVLVYVMGCIDFPHDFINSTYIDLSSQNMGIPHIVFINASLNLLIDDTFLC